MVDLFSGLKNIFHCYAHSLILMRSLFIISIESTGLSAVENSDVSSANNFTSNSKFSGRSFMCTKKGRCPSAKLVDTLPKLMIHLKTGH